MRKILLCLLLVMACCVCSAQTQPHWLQISDKPLLDIRNFGAKAGDAIDDTAAIQAAFASASAGKGIVFIPGGTFRAVNLDVPSNVIIMGTGVNSVIKRHSAGNHIPIFGIGSTFGGPGTPDPDDNVKNVVIRDLTIDGSGWGGVATYSEEHSVEFNGVTNLTVDNCHFYGWSGDALSVGVTAGAGGYSECHNINVKITNCVFDGINWDNRNAITILDCSGLWIENNHFMRCTATGNPGPIDIETEAIMTDPVNRDFWIQDNLFEDFGGDAAVSLVIKAQDVITNKPKNFNFIGNTVRSVRSGVTNPWSINVRIEDTVATAATKLTPEHNITIKDNHLLGGGQIRWANGIVIENNTFASSTRPLSLIGTRRARVVGNTFKKLGDDSPANALLLTDLNSDLTIHGNIFSDPATSSMPAIRIGDTASVLNSISGLRFTSNWFHEDYGAAMYQSYASTTWPLNHKNLIHSNELNGLTFPKEAILLSNVDSLSPHDFTVSPFDGLADTFAAPGPVKFGRLKTERLQTDTAFYSGAPEGTTLQTFIPHQNVGTPTYTIYYRLSIASSTWGDWFTATGTVVAP